jgi:hypothetical protein
LSRRTSSNSCRTGGESHNWPWTFGRKPVAYAPIGRNIERTRLPRNHDDETSGTVPSPASLLVFAKSTPPGAFGLIVAVVQVSPPQPQTFVTGSVSNCWGNGPCAVAARSRMYCSAIHD